MEKFENHMKFLDNFIKENEELNFNLNYDVFNFYEKYLPNDFYQIKHKDKIEKPIKNPDEVAKIIKDSNIKTNTDKPIFNSQEDFYQIKDKLVYNLSILSNKIIKFNQLTITINPFSFELLESKLNKDLIKSCEILNIKFIISYSDSLELDPNSKDEISSYKYKNCDFQFLKRFNAKFINLKLEGASFKNVSTSNSGNEFQDHVEDKIKNLVKKSKENILSLKINDLRNEFNRVENIEYFYKCLTENSDTNHLEKFTLKNTIIYCPLALIKLGEIIRELNLRELKFENIGVSFEINESTYEALTYFFNSILQKKLSRLVFRDFPILDLNFIQKFTEYTCKNYLIIYEFTHSMINRELEVLKYDDNKGYYCLQANSCLNYCLNVEKLDLRSLFGNIKSVKLRNLKLRTNMFSIKKSKFFKKLFYKSDFNKNILKIDFNNCNSKEWNVFGDEEFQKEFSLDIKFPHNKEVLKKLCLEKLTYTLLKEDNSNFTIMDINDKFIISESQSISDDRYINNNLLENIQDICKNLEEIKISKETESEYKISPSLKKLSLTDCFMFYGLKKIIKETNFEELKLKFSKPLNNYDIKFPNLFYSNINHLCLSRYAINLQITENKDLLSNIKIDKLTIKQVSDKVIENKSFFKILDVSFSKIRRLSIIQCEFKENFRIRPSQTMENLSRVDIDFYSFFNIFDGKKKDLNSCEQDVKYFIEYFLNLSYKLHPGNIYVDGKAILSQNYFSDLVDKIYENIPKTDT